MRTPYLIRPALMADRPLLARWRAMPQVIRWWGDPDEDDDTDEVPDLRISKWVAELDRRPFAFIQDYAVAAWSPHHFDYLPAGSRGMDIFIGEADLLGLGHGSGLVNQHVSGLFERGAAAVGIDPHPDNVAARRAFEKAGFEFRRGPLDTPWGRVNLMDRFAVGHNG